MFSSPSVNKGRKMRTAPRCYVDLCSFCFWCNYKRNDTDTFYKAKQCLSIMVYSGCKINHVLMSLELKPIWSWDVGHSHSINQLPRNIEELTASCHSEWGRSRFRSSGEWVRYFYDQGCTPQHCKSNWTFRRAKESAEKSIYISYSKDGSVPKSTTSRKSYWYSTRGGERVREPDKSWRRRGRPKTPDAARVDRFACYTGWWEELCWECAVGSGISWGNETEIKGQRQTDTERETHTHTVGS